MHNVMILFLKLCFKNLYRFFTDSHYRIFLWFVLIYSGKSDKKTFKVRLQGKELIVPHALSFIWQYYEIYADEFYKFETNRKKPLIIDLGSNIGLSIIYFRENYPGAMIYAYEADPDIFNILEKNLQNRGILDDNLKLRNKAIWINDEGVYFNGNKADAGRIIGSKQGEKEEKIATERLKNLLDIVDHVDFLKMDIEGAEVKVLEDSSGNLSKIDQMFIEYHSFHAEDQKLDTILSILSRSGFRYQIHSPFRYKRPFFKKTLQTTPEMDLQINIFAYRQ